MKYFYKLNITLLTAITLAGCVQKRSDVDEIDYTNAEGLELDDVAGIQRTQLSLKTFDGILQSMAAVTATSPSTVTINAYNAALTSLPREGTTEEITAATLMGISTLAGAVCLDLHNKEFGAGLNDPQRIYYRGIANNGSNFNNAMRDRVIGDLAVGFWGRSITAQERVFFEEALSSSYSAATMPTSLNAFLAQGAQIHSAGSLVQTITANDGATGELRLALNILCAGALSSMPGIQK